MTNSNNLEDTNQKRLLVSESGEASIVSDSLGFSIQMSDTVESIDLTDDEYIDFLKKTENHDLIWNPETGQVEALRYNRIKEQDVPIEADIPVDDLDKGDK